MDELPLAQQCGGMISDEVSVYDQAIRNAAGGYRVDHRIELIDGYGAKATQHIDVV